jgi:AAA family ATP:ADP antiporter
LLRDRYLLLIASLIVLLNWCNSAGEYIFDRAILAAVESAGVRGAEAHAFVGGIKADYFAWYNGLGMLLQLFAVSRILAKLGVRAGLLFLPVFAFFGYAWAAAMPTLAVLRLVKIGENALEYSVAETTKHALYLVTSRVEKYVGKTSVDTIAVRVGAILSASVAWIGGRVTLPIGGFAALNVALAAVWIGVVLAIGREHARRRGETELQLAAEPTPP